MQDKPLRVLVVDDDECDRIAMRRALAKAAPGAEVHDVDTFAGGLTLLAEEAFDCVFVDYRLPDGDGMELLSAVRARGLPVSVVMLTGHGDEALAVEALQAGAADYIGKSTLTAERLRRALDRGLHRAPARVASGREHSYRLAQAIDNAAESMMITGPDGRIEYVNSAFVVLTGYRSGELVGNNPRLLKSPHTPAAVHRKLWQTVAAGRVWRGELVVRRKDGSEFLAALAVAPLLDERGGIEGFVATHRDIDAERRRAAEMERLANTDGLTGLYNHRHFVDRLDEELSRARRYSRPLCLMLIDLDEFKQINDTHGHLKGDEVLAGCARVIREVTRASDVVGRYGGEEFAVVLPETGLERAVALAERLRDRCERQGYADPQGRRFAVTCSIGVAAYREGDGRECLVGAADRALYRAKRNGRNRVETGEAGASAAIGAVPGSVRTLSHNDPESRSIR